MGKKNRKGKGSKSTSASKPSKNTAPPSKASIRDFVDGSTFAAYKGPGEVVFDYEKGIYVNSLNNGTHLTLAEKYFDDRQNYELVMLVKQNEYTIDEIRFYEPLFKKWLYSVGREDEYPVSYGTNNQFIEGFAIKTGEIDYTFGGYYWSHLDNGEGDDDEYETDVGDDDKEENSMSTKKKYDEDAIDVKDTVTPGTDADDDNDGIFGSIGSLMRLQRRNNGDSTTKDTLRPTKTGQKQIASFKRSKKSPAAIEDDDTDGKFRLKDSLVHSIDTMLEETTDSIKAGKLNNAYDSRETENINDFIEAFNAADINDPLLGTMAKRIRVLITIAKSFYEYDDKQRLYISNFNYDGIIAKYLELGNIEPTGIVPKGSKVAKKTAITYPELHNNMDKAYIINSGDPIPTGVKERTSIETFLTKCYKEIGASSESVIEIELSPKIDGVSVNGTTVEDMLTNPQTRGDETESVSIVGLNGIKVGDEGINDAPTFGIQYEMFVTEKDRKAASDYLGLEVPYASCRHAAAGIAQRLSTGEDDGLLEFVSMYPIATSKLDGTYSERMDFIQNYAIVPDDMIERKVIKGNMSKLLDHISKYFEKLGNKRSELSYTIDGMVITIVDEDYQDMIGRDGRTNKYQIALKFDPASAQGKVAGISLDTGSKGFRTIQIALEEPVYLDGVRYDHVPVLSAALFENLELRMGSKVAIHRVGDVIPSISVIKAGDGPKLELPTKCPHCTGKLKTKAKKLYCDNPNCTGNIAGRLYHMISGLDVVGYSIEFAKALVRTGNALNLSDLFTLNTEALANSGLTGKRYFEFTKTLKLAIANKRDFEILSIMGVPEIGGSRAKDLLSEVGGFKALIDIPEDEIYRACNAVKGLSDVDAVADYLNSKTFRKEVATISKYIDTFTDDFDNLTRVGHTGGNLTKEAKEVCRKAGFSIVDGKRFDILIVPSKNHKSDKVTRAIKKNIPIMTNDEFVEKYQN